jgi:hypothetical protein
VPAQLSNNLFWARYFFKVSQLEEEHRKRVKLIERVTVPEPDSSAANQDWGSDYEEEETQPKSDQVADQQKKDEEDENDQTPVPNEDEQANSEQVDQDGKTTPTESENLANQEANSEVSSESKLTTSLRPEDSTS